MRIMLTSPSMQVGGAERMLTLLAAGLVERGHEVAVVAPPGARDADLSGVTHTRIPLSDRGRSAAGASRALADLARAIRQVEPDLVHAQNVKNGAVAALAARLARPLRRPRVLTTFHGVLPDEYRSSARLLRLPDHVACVSSDVRARLLACGLPEQRATIVRNAVEPLEPLSAERRAQLDEELGLGPGALAVAVGRLVPQKAHRRFLRAAAVAAERVPDAQFLIVGEGPLRDRIEADIARTGLDGRVRLIGVRPDARDLIARSDALVFSSDWEGLSVAALEALAAGVPVVSTDVEGMRELLADGAGATAPLDDGTALGERLSDVLESPDLRREMGERGRSLVEAEFSPARMIDAYLGCYRYLIGASGSRRGELVR
jgi:glycosyltransferase involved in cell wall biosynthesis